MFTGIIEEVGKVVEMTKTGGSELISIEAPRTLSQLKVNDSVSLNGVCQTVIKKSRSTFTVQAVEETLLKTSLGKLKVSSPVNLELPLRIGDRLGGHFVQGHIDGVGVIKSIVKQESSWLVMVQIPDQFVRYVVPVGSVAVDGVSLTVASVQSSDIVLSIIPHTLERTIFNRYAVGTEVNLEFDIIGKYIEKLVDHEQEVGEKSSLSVDKLKEWGYDG
jgi:riboflavin synthase